MPYALRSLFASLSVRRSTRATHLFQRTDDALSALVLLLAVPLQLGCIGWLGVVLDRPLWCAGLLPVLLWLFLRSGKRLRIRPGEVRARRVFFGLPMPGVTVLRGPIRLERRCWEQDFGVFVPVVALVDALAAEVELRVQPGQEERLREALELALSRADGPPVPF
jgi:hypothetical protein